MVPFESHIEVDFADRPAFPEIANPPLANTSVCFESIEFACFGVAVYEPPTDTVDGEGDPISISSANISIEDGVTARPGIHEL
jgi:hypothetical protein